MSTDQAHELAPSGRIEPEWTTGDRLRKARRIAGMTQAEFADVLRVSKASLQNWEADHRLPSYQSLMLIAMMCEYQFGIPVDWMMASDDRGTDISRAFARRVGSRMRHFETTGEDLYPEDDSPNSPFGEEEVERARRDSNPKPSDP